MEVLNRLGDRRAASGWSGWIDGRPGARTSRTSATTGGSCLSLIVADRCVDPVQAKSPFFRCPILQVAIDELQPRSIGIGQSRHARDKELLRSADRQDIRVLVDV